MILYCDTSAVVPLTVEEPSSDTCRRLWDAADTVITTRLLYVEAAAALAQALRMGRTSESEHRGAVRLLDRFWADLDVVEVYDAIVRRAARLAHACSLRGYDAVHCASAEQINDPELVMASGDRKLLSACATLGIATADTNGAARGGI